MVAVDKKTPKKVKKKDGLKKKVKSAVKKKKSVSFKREEGNPSEQSVTVDSLIESIRQETDEKDSELSKVLMDDSSDQEPELIDAAEHTNLLKNFGISHKPRKVKEKVLSVAPLDKEIEGKVSLSDLITSASKTESLKSVEQFLEVGKDAKTLDEPLARHQKEQAEREVNYDRSKKEVTKWLPLVKRNRESSHMTYPLYHSQNTRGAKEDISSFANKIQKPTTKLEEEIYEVLTADSRLLERPDHLLTEAEEKTLEELNAEEAELRREELSKIRALMSFQEEKFRRKNKIKSKKYRRILKKERQKVEEKELSDAVKANPGVADTEAEKADYLRALERISQKHKVGGKWNKNLLHKQIRDPDLKSAMSEQRQLRQKLMEKQDISSDDEEIGAEEPAEVQNSATKTTEEEAEEEFEVDPNNPWLVVGSALTGQSELEKVLPVPTDSRTTEEEDEEEDEEEEEEDDNSAEEEDKKKEVVPRSAPSMEQEMLVDMAFANDDVVAQFREEKDKIVDDETEKDIDLTLPGWGSWGGIGTNDKPRKQIIQKAAPTAPRKDAALGHVIINAKKNRKLQQHQVHHLPHPYKSRSVFEREMRQPIGPQWNSVRSFRNMIKPSESVLDGHVIEPMTAPKGFDKVIIRGRRRAKS